MALLYYGHDAELQAIKRCSIHEENCTYYRRNPEEAMCHKCKLEHDGIASKPDDED